MTADKIDRFEQAAVLALVNASAKRVHGPDSPRIEWHRIASMIEQEGSALRLVRREQTALDEDQVPLAATLADQVSVTDLERQRWLIDDMDSHGVHLLTVLDEDYPSNLRSIYNLPPFLFVRGTLLAVDDRSVAVVGTRKATAKGRELAADLARELVRHGVTVLSGLARGIDTSAHEAALEGGGRTVAVVGTGISHVYPAENRGLADRIAATGAVASQFWPDSPPTRTSFPMRNVVMSGMAIGTAVIEASETSGAKMQARLALEHGKHLFLMRALVDQEPWARTYATRPGAVVVESVDDIIRVVTAVIETPHQPSLF